MAHTDLPEEIINFENAQRHLDEFVERAENRPIIEELNRRILVRNEALQQAKKVAKMQPIKSDHFVLNRNGVRYDWESLYALVGTKRFLEVGGCMEDIKKYSGDKKRLEAAIAQGRLQDVNIDNIRRPDIAYATASLPDLKPL